VPAKSMRELPPGAIARLGVSRLPMGSPKAFAADGKSFLGVMDRFILRFDSETAKEIECKALPDGFTAASFSKDGRLLIGGNQSRELVLRMATELQVLDIGTGRVVFRHSTRKDFHEAQLALDGKSIVVREETGQGGRLLIWDVLTGAERVVAEKI